MFGSKKISFAIKVVIITLLATSILTACNKSIEPEPRRDSSPLTCRKPQYLKAGDKVALISPSYYTPMENVNKAADVLRSWGLEPVIGPNVGNIYEKKYAGTTDERFSDIHWALSDPTIKAILCNRGGYGTIQLIDKLSLREIGRSEKWIIGFSDICTLHGAWQNSGIMSIHGTMSSFLAQGGTDATSTLVRDILMGRYPKYEIPAHPQNIEGIGQGTLVGGNLCTIAPNVGSLADATLHEGIILFLEEVGESMRNIDRQFNILALNGVLNHCNGIILGEFPDCGTEFDYKSIEEMLRSYILHYNIPLLCGFPAGHDDVNLPLIMGAKTTMTVRPTGSTIEFSLDGEQQTVNTADIPTLKRGENNIERNMRLAGKIN
ncbi:MAG: LD-carboxypeptidase [Bacteroidales bacterium]|nr:LD-carboxypeptidase [Bacteroidales bacterium]MDY6426957.1 LD-carboxypeptidase [Bacteroidales bacterium]